MSLPGARLLHQFEQFNIHPVASRVAGPLQVEFFLYHGLAQFHDVFPLEGEGAVLEIYALGAVFFRQEFEFLDHPRDAEVPRLLSVNERGIAESALIRAAPGCYSNG